MWRFYGSLVKDIPRLLRGTTRAWTFWVLTILVPLALAVLASLKPFAALPQFSGWWAVAPLAVSFAYAMLRVNYEKHVDAQRELRMASDYELARSEFGAIRTALGHYLTAFASLQDACVANPHNLHEHLAFLNSQIALTRDFVSRHFDGGDAALFTAEHLDIDIDPNVERHLRTAPETLRIYRIAGAKAREIRKLLESTRPANTASASVPGRV